MSSASLPTSKTFWRQTAFISVIAIIAAYNVKQNIYLRKRSQFRPDELELSQNDKPNEAYDISKIRPGFPTASSDEAERKSEYEGASGSYLTRKRGDKFSSGIWGK